MKMQLVMLSALLALPLSASHDKFESQWQDVSTTEDGISPSKCDDPKKHCIFKLLPTRQMWTSVSLNESESGIGELKDQASAVEACKSMKNWGGYDDWRLPTLTEMSNVSNYIETLIRKLQRLILPEGEIASMIEDNFYWTSTAIWTGSDEPIDEQDPNKSWAFSYKHPYRQLPRSAPLTWLCTRNETQKFWEDKSTLADGKTSTTCSQESDQCLFLDKRTGMLWTEITPGQDDNDPGSQRLLTQSRAISKCKSLQWAGHKGFRVPTILELERVNSDGVFLTSLAHDFYGVYGEVWSDQTQPGSANGHYELSFELYHSSSGKFQGLGTRHPNVRKHYHVTSYSQWGRPFSQSLPWVCVKSIDAPVIPPAPPIPPIDSDRDGVFDDIDRCPYTPKGKKVWKPGDKTKDGKPISPRFYGCAGGEIPVS